MNRINVPRVGGGGCITEIFFGVHIDETIAGGGVVT